MNQKEKMELDAYITGYHREEKRVHIPAGVDLTCPVCDTEFTTKKAYNDDDRLVCIHCSADLVVVDGDLEEVDDHIYDDDEDEEDEEFEDEDELEPFPEDVKDEPEEH